MKEPEQAIVFESGGQRLLGILHGAGGGATGVLVIVGGPQYRVGSHRQFVLLARRLAAHNVPVMRFDCQGMGDSEGVRHSFEEIYGDMRSAIDTFFEHSPGLTSVVLWGLCDAATASALYAAQDPRVSGVVLLNPWVQTREGRAKTYLRHYYLRRIIEAGFWAKVFQRKFSFRRSAHSLLGNLFQALKKPVGREAENGKFVERMYQGLKDFPGRIAIILSGDDLTAAEFEYLVRGERRWKKLMDAKGVEYCLLPKADHTFSRQVWRDEVADFTLRWVSRP